MKASIRTLILIMSLRNRNNPIIFNFLYSIYLRRQNLNHQSLCRNSQSHHSSRSVHHPIPILTKVSNQAKISPMRRTMRSNCTITTTTLTRRLWKSRRTVTSCGFTTLVQYGYLKCTSKKGTAQSTSKEWRPSTRNGLRSCVRSARPLEQVPA
jgi:hypothetical protein